MADKLMCAESLLVTPLLLGAAGWAIFGLALAVCLGSFIGVVLAAACSLFIIRRSRPVNQMAYELRDASFELVEFYFQMFPKHP